MLILFLPQCKNASIRPGWLPFLLTHPKIKRKTFCPWCFRFQTRFSFCFVFLLFLGFSSELSTFRIWHLCENVVIRLVLLLFIALWQIFQLLFKLRLLLMCGWERHLNILSTDLFRL